MRRTPKYSMPRSLWEPRVARRPKYTARAKTAVCTNTGPTAACRLANGSRTSLRHFTATPRQPPPPDRQRWSLRRTQARPAPARRLRPRLSINRVKSVVLARFEASLRPLFGSAFAASQYGSRAALRRSGTANRLVRVFLDTIRIVHLMPPKFVDL